MDKIAMLEYSFIFDPDEVWSRGWEFEIDLVDFFNSKGFKAKVIETSGNASRRVLYVQKDDIAVVPPIVNKEMTFKKPTSEKVEVIATPEKS
jgi:hypothetical protein